MERPANTDVDIHPLLAQRHSPYAFDPERSVAEADVRALFEAARWTMSSSVSNPDSMSRVKTASSPFCDNPYSCMRSASVFPDLTALAIFDALSFAFAIIDLSPLFLCPHIAGEHYKQGRYTITFQPSPCTTQSALSFHHTSGYSTIPATVIRSELQAFR